LVLCGLFGLDRWGGLLRCPGGCFFGPSGGLGLSLGNLRFGGVAFRGFGLIDRFNGLCGILLGRLAARGLLGLALGLLGGRCLLRLVLVGLLARLVGLLCLAGLVGFAGLLLGVALGLEIGRASCRGRVREGGAWWTVV